MSTTYRPAMAATGQEMTEMGWTRRATVSQRIRISVALVLCACVAAITIRLVRWSDAITDDLGRCATVIATDQGGVWVRFDGPLSHERLPTFVPRNAIKQRTLGAKSLLERVNLFCIGAALGVSFLTLLVVAWRWSVLLSATVGKVAIRTTVVWLVHATFAEVVGFGQIGQDACRIVLAGRRLSNFSGALAVQLTERAIGLGVLLGLTITSMYFVSWPTISLQRAPGWLKAIGLSMLCAVGLLCWFARRRASQRTQAGRTWTPPPLVTQLGRALAPLRSRPCLVAQIVALSLAIHSLNIVYHYTLSTSLRLPIGFAAFLAAVPLVSIALALPISVGGVGVFEGLMVLTLAPLSAASASEILILCVLHRLMTVPQRLVLAIALFVPVDDVGHRHHHVLAGRTNQDGPVPPSAGANSRAKLTSAIRGVLQRRLPSRAIVARDQESA